MEIHQWKMSHWDKEKAHELAAATGKPQLVCDLLAGRGFDEPEKVDAFLGDEPLFSPFLLKDMDKAVERIRRAIGAGEQIAIYGDYDCDGITSTVLMYNYLESAGADVTYYIPDREQEGYGLNKGAIRLMADNKVGLVLTVDNGVSALEEIAYAASLGIDVVVTDHHQPREELPAAVAVVDPHRADCPSPFKNLAGVGVAFKLICAMEGDESGEMLEPYGDIVALGTLADIVELAGENRTIVRKGLRHVNDTQNVGLAALIGAAGLEGKAITSESVSFGLVPRINACGRLGAVDDAVELLLCEDEERAKVLAEKIDKLNGQRKSIEADIVEDIRKKLQQNPALLYQRVLVIAGENWHHGVVGIAASRLTERFGKPCLLLSADGAEARGSARSVEGFSMIEAISACAPLLTRYGGHPAAAGVTLPADRVEEFASALNQFAQDHFPLMPAGSISIDRELEPGEATVAAVESLAQLEPFGSGNEVPTFLLRDMTLAAITPLSEGKHLRLRLTKGTQAVNALYFGMTPARFAYQAGDRVDLVVGLSLNEYNGETRTSIKVKDMRFTGIDQAHVLRRKQDYDSFARGEVLSEETVAAVEPTRGEAAVVYRFLKESGGYPHGRDMLYGRLMEQGLDYLKVCLVVDMLLDLGLAQEEEQDGAKVLQIARQREKVDLFSAETLKRLRGLKSVSEHG